MEMSLSGYALINNPLLNKGTAFSAAERDGQSGAFGEQVVREMARHVERPIILPLSNPTSKSEATPEDLLHWTEGKAVIGTGSPFAAVRWKDREISIAQTNNSYIFPGMGLGVLVSGATRVTDLMFMVAAKTLAGLSPSLRDADGALLPPLHAARPVAIAIAEAVAQQAVKEGVAELDGTQPIKDRLTTYVWTPEYRELTPTRQR